MIRGITFAGKPAIVAAEAKKGDAETGFLS